MRRFRIYDENKIQIGSITCAYVLINAVTSRIQRMSTLPIPLPMIEDCFALERYEDMEIRDLQVNL